MVNPVNNKVCSVGENHSLLLDILCKQALGLNVVHFNARSLSGDKLDYVRSVFEESLVDVICVSETWFSPDTCDFTTPFKTII